MIEPFLLLHGIGLNSQKNRIVSLGSKESNVDASDFDRLRESKEAHDWYENITKMIYS